ncbi:hypothetical protein IJ556_04890 [bacterium]|nr:hypothetical protein [bacterium]MBR1862007.1 hypothetical protein [Lachnospiraceae bacterium]
MYEKHINNYINNNKLFTVTDIQKAVGVCKEKKAVFNTELTRMEKKGYIVRIKRGIYAVPEKTCFGDILPDNNLIANKFYMENDNGYVTGPTFLNQIGLSTWLPTKTYIKSNHNRRKMTAESFVIAAPVVKISSKNKPYLQFLDGLGDMQKYAVDKKDPEKLLCYYIKKMDMDVGLLFTYAHKYYRQNVTETLYRIMEKYYEIT